ncbi:hypothetical protein [Thioalkalivibrio sp. XN8]|uniref:hypothetical protein n=1 Tax=Thioalkalivibrio sp. XN8 TaxID=2712863 RepID=UPI0013ED4928|nr:hypothetical protein [Thioalkalivibrio sp. XN8]NGP54438.1 hypothetical protein [Thioalkalivibrio sp. XN8]
MDARAGSKRVADNAAVQGEFFDLAGERCYVIRNVDRMPPFFISVVSDDDHWLFLSSTGGLTAGRVSPQHALFPYITVDKLHESAGHTGSRTLVRVRAPDGPVLWEPFNPEHAGDPALTRNIYKNTLGNKVCFEEVHHELGLAFRYWWMSSREYGFVRRCELENQGDDRRQLELLDGLQNLLPANTPLYTQTNVSNLVDAYKWNELDPATGLALLTLYSTITDRAEPSESLKATTVFCLGLEAPTVLLSSRQVDGFRLGLPLVTEERQRGERGAYFVGAAVDLAPGGIHDWELVANTAQGQKEVVALRRELREPAELRRALARSIATGSDRLARIMAAADGFQATAEEHVTVHHYANVLFNVLRGGIFFDQYSIRSGHFARTVRHFNQPVYERNKDLLDSLPPRISLEELNNAVAGRGDAQLSRLAAEYLPITFSRRHGDPSRPWNQFAIRLHDQYGKDLLAYEGNWRDIFQNWEALAFSFPAFVGGMITKFVNGSTMDGYNPYRITQEGIDWEVEDPDDPWSYIGYWGDHQVIYLLKLLELSRRFYPDQLRGLLHERLFCYANVPYRIEPFSALLQDPQQTISYDEELGQEIERRIASLGADGKLVLDDTGEVQLVTLAEKLLVPLLAKLGNLVVDGGIWLNTQRPEWNDANNALVGHGLSMVTLCYMRRYAAFLGELVAEAGSGFALSSEVARWLEESAAALAQLRPELDREPLADTVRYRVLAELGEAAGRHRATVYRQEGLSGPVQVPAGRVTRLLDDALAAIDHSIQVNRREDGLFHSYNLVSLGHHAVGVEPLYPMLEGQVAALSAGTIAPREAAKVLETLFDSELYRPDQHSFLLYPDRELPSFLEKNRIPPADVAELPVLGRMLAEGDERLVLQDAEGCYRFSAEFRNVRDLDAEIDRLLPEYGGELEAARPALRRLYESVFRHRAFTGRSGTMFAFEGLGSIYWHMVAKLLLAAQENFFAAVDQGADEETCRRLGRLYYRIRAGIGFNKRPSDYGAFPTDPYSHTPSHAGAQQPGMTGQVKEEILARFGELGVRVRGGAARFQPALLKPREFSEAPLPFRYLDVDGCWQELEVPAGALAFTWCQVPVVYHLAETGQPVLVVTRDDGSQDRLDQPSLPAADSADLFARNGRIRRLDLNFPSTWLFT